MIVYHNSREVIVLRSDSNQLEFAETRDLDEYERVEVIDGYVITFSPSVYHPDVF